MQHVSKNVNDSDVNAPRLDSNIHDASGPRPASRGAQPWRHALIWVPLLPVEGQVLVRGPPSGPLPTFHRKQVPEDDVSPGTSGLKRKKRQNGLGCGTCRPQDSVEARSARHAAQQPLMVLTISRGTEYGQALHPITSEQMQSASAADMRGKAMPLPQTSLIDLPQPSLKVRFIAL